MNSRRECTNAPGKPRFCQRPEPIQPLRGVILTHRTQPAPTPLGRRAVFVTRRDPQLVNERPRPGSAPLQERLEELARITLRALHNISVPPIGTKVDQPFRGLYHVEVVLDNDDGVALLDQPV
jgi:hypothetical protein